MYILYDQELARTDGGDDMMILPVLSADDTRQYCIWLVSLDRIDDQLCSGPVPSSLARRAVRGRIKSTGATQRRTTTYGSEL